MREIKFRGQTKLTKEWAYGYLLKLCDKYYITITDYYNTIKDDITGNINAIWEENDFIEVYEDSIGQYTGQKDKNGKEIYEGDIVRFEDIGEDGYEYKEGFDFENEAQVIYKEGQVTLTNFGEGDNSHYATDGQVDILDEILRNGNCEVIGNIYDNPELLKGE